MEKSKGSRKDLALLSQNELCKVVQLISWLSPEAILKAHIVNHGTKMRIKIIDEKCSDPVQKYSSSGVKWTGAWNLDLEIQIYSFGCGYQSMNAGPYTYYDIQTI